MSIKSYARDFAGGPQTKSACQCRDMGLIRGAGKILHALGQLSPCATATEPGLWDTLAQPVKPWAQSLCSATGERRHNESLRIIAEQLQKLWSTAAKT